jgi:hypothetical protein
MMRNSEWRMRNLSNADCGMQNAEYKSFTPNSALRIPNLKYSAFRNPHSEIEKKGEYNESNGIG